MSDPTEPHNGNGDSEPVAAAIPVVAAPVAPVPVDDDDGLLDLDDPDLDAPDLEFGEPVIAPMLLPDDGLPDDHAIDDLVPDDLEERLARLEAATNGGAPAPDDITARMLRLEQAAQALAEAERARDGRRVRRKVSAASLGAGVAAAIPVILQLAGAFDLSPELTSTISAACALLGAFAAGWSTPERKPSLPEEVVPS